MEAPRRIVLVEGDSDVAAVCTLARTVGLDLVAEGIDVRAANGVTNYPKLIGKFRRDLPEVPLRGLYDQGEERHVGSGLGVAIEPADRPVDMRAAIEEQGFFVCVADLEDELIRALGTDGVEQVLAEHDDLRSFRRFQAQPQHRDGATSQQLRRFMGTRATRKIRYGRLLVEALAPALAPLPLLRVLDLA